MWKSGFLWSKLGIWLFDRCESHRFCGKHVKFTVWPVWKSGNQWICCLTNVNVRSSVVKSRNLLFDQYESQGFFDENQECAVWPAWKSECLWWKSEIYHLTSVKVMDSVGRPPYLSVFFCFQQKEFDFQQWLLQWPLVQEVPEWENGRQLPAAADNPICWAQWKRCFRQRLHPRLLLQHQQWLGALSRSREKVGPCWQSLVCRKNLCVEKVVRKIRERKTGDFCLLLENVEWF